MSEKQVSETEPPILLGKARNNPYTVAAILLAQRLAWDLRPVSWISRRRLNVWKDQYTGQKAVILCNGPSLLKTDFSLLEGVFTIAMNKINLLFDKTDFRPSCIVAQNPHVIDQNKDFFNTTSLPLFFSHFAAGQIRLRKNVTFVHEVRYNRKFSRDCSLSVYMGPTVTFAALQLAFHFGFQEVALVGCDHNFATKGPANKEVVAEESDPNHFDPNYFAGGVKWHLPDLAESEGVYLIARNTFEAAGRRVVNATEGGKLEIFERQSLKTFLQGT